MNETMENRIKRPGWWQPAAIGAGCALSVLFPPLMAVAPGFLGYLGVAGGMPMLLLGAGVCVALTYLLAGVLGLWALCALLPPAFLLALLLRRKSAYFEAALYTAGLSTAGLYAMYGLRDILAGQKAFYAIRQIFLEMEGPMAEQAGLMGLDPALMAEYVRAMAANVEIVMPALLCALGAATGLLSLLACRALSRRMGAPVKPMRSFALWAVPKPAMQGAVILCAGLLLCAYVLRLPAMDAIVPAGLVVILAPFTVQGLSLMWFLLHVRKSGCMGPGMLAVLLVITFPYSLFTCATLGVLEQLLHLRKRILENGPK